MDTPNDIDALADALRVDGVVIDRVLGSGETEEVHDRIAKLVRETPFPVYVALVEQPQGLPSGDSVDVVDALATTLNRRLGDGLYILRTYDSIQQVYAFGLDTDPAQVSLSAYRTVDALEAAMAEVGDFTIGTEDYIAAPASAKAEIVAMGAEEILAAGRGPYRDSYPSAVSAQEAEQVATHALAVQKRASWRPGAGYVEVRAASSGLSSLLGGLSGLVAALLVGQSLRGWPRKGKPAAAAVSAGAGASPVPDLEQERARARELATILTSKLERFDWDKARDRGIADRALSTRDAVEQLLGSGDVADLIGAQVIARMGTHDLVRGRRGSGARLTPCFFDPRHPESKTAVAWRLGDGEVEVPCCAACAEAISREDEPQFLRLSTRRGTAAYWQRDSVWARTGFGSISDDLARDVLADRAERR